MAPHDDGLARLDDAALLEAVAGLWHELDPPPDDLASGVLARIAAEDLDYELLTLVETTVPSGVRSSARQDEEPATRTLEYHCPDFRVHLRITRREDGTRLDGWVVPARAFTVELRADGGPEPQSAVVDEHGRFEFARAPSGPCRLTFLEEPRTLTRPRITPPFEL